MTKVYKIVKEEVVTSQKSHKHVLIDSTVITPSKNEVVWQYVKSRDVVTIVAINEKQEIYCVRQWRPARKEYVWELPAGGIEDKNPTSKQVLENANRELQEEIGVKAKNLKIISSFSPSIHMTSTYYVVLAKQLTKSSLPQDLEEDLEVKAIAFDEAYDLLISKQLPSSMTLVGMLLAKQYCK